MLYRDDLADAAGAIQRLTSPSPVTVSLNLGIEDRAAYARAADSFVGAGDRRILDRFRSAHSKGLLMTSAFPMDC